MAKPLPDLWRIELSATTESLALFEEALGPFVDTISWFAVGDIDDPDVGWRIEGFARRAPDRPALVSALSAAAAALGIEPPDPHHSRVPERDWLADNLRDFPPIRAGRFFVHGSHYEDALPAGTEPLEIDAGTAFGSGEHATTWGCLVALDGLGRRRRFHRPLDVGCGSGILSLAMARLWPARVRAVDIDPRAAQVARFNALRNGLGARVRTSPNHGYRGFFVARGGPYDLVTANILARPLMAMAKDLDRHLAPGGVAVLSGLLGRHFRAVLNAHRQRGFRLVRRIVVNDWQTLIIRKG
ncbi:MAG: 50S ribosomal protein L11 methyltransferase [Alphaproteobacteria bacterium]|nr:50S ribosomal protein L11 methyltransferase [Alphaproteobacteria bacterium]